MDAWSTSIRPISLPIYLSLFHLFPLFPLSPPFPPFFFDPGKTQQVQGIVGARKDVSGAVASMGTSMGTSIPPEQLQVCVNVNLCCIHT